MCAQLTRDLFARAKFLFSYPVAFVMGEGPVEVLPSRLVRKMCPVCVVASDLEYSDQGGIESSHDDVGWN